MHGKLHRRFSENTLSKSFEIAMCVQSFICYAINYESAHLFRIARLVANLLRIFRGEDGTEQLQNRKEIRTTIEDNEENNI